jgi:hypothetical protein
VLKYADGRVFCQDVARGARADSTERFVGGVSLFLLAAGSLVGTGAVASQGMPQATVENGTTIEPGTLDVLGYFAATTGLTAMAGLATAGGFVLLDRAAAASELEAAAAVAANLPEEKAAASCNDAIAEWASARAEAAAKLKQEIQDRQKKMEERLIDSDGDGLSDAKDKCPLAIGEIKNPIPGCPSAFAYTSAGKKSSDLYPTAAEAEKACKASASPEPTDCTTSPVP